MVDLISGSHHHLKGRDQLTAGCTVPRRPKEPAEAERVTGKPVNWMHTHAHTFQRCSRKTEADIILKKLPVFLREQQKNIYIKCCSRTISEYSLSVLLICGAFPAGSSPAFLQTQSPHSLVCICSQVWKKKKDSQPNYNYGHTRGRASHNRKRSHVIKQRLQTIKFIIHKFYYRQR